LSVLSGYLTEAIACSAAWENLLLWVAKGCTCGTQPNASRRHQQEQITNLNTENNALPVPLIHAVTRVAFKFQKVILLKPASVCETGSNARTWRSQFLKYSSPYFLKMSATAISGCASSITLSVSKNAYLYQEQGILLVSALGLWHFCYGIYKMK
jgi:hypothetical protein